MRNEKKSFFTRSSTSLTLRGILKLSKAFPFIFLAISIHFSSLADFKPLEFNVEGLHLQLSNLFYDSIFSFRDDDEFSLNHDTHLTRIVYSFAREWMFVVCSTSAASAAFSSWLLKASNLKSLSVLKANEAGRMFQLCFYSSKAPIIKTIKFLALCSRLLHLNHSKICSMKVSFSSALHPRTS